MQDVTDGEFESTVLKAKGLVLVDFWAPWCAPCKALMPTLEAALEKLQGKVMGVKVNIEDNPLTPSQYNVMTIPTLVLFEGGKVVDTRVGSGHSEDDLVAWVEEHQKA